MRELWEIPFEEVYKLDPPWKSKKPKNIYQDGYDPFTEYVIKESDRIMKTRMKGRLN